MKVKAYWQIDKVNDSFAKRIRDILNEDTEVLVFTYEINEEDIVTDVCFDEASTGNGGSLVGVTGEQRRLVEDAVWGEIVGVKHIYSIETLFHFNCGLCKSWWSIGDFNIKQTKSLTCPYCTKNADLVEDTKEEYPKEIEELFDKFETLL